MIIIATIGHSSLSEDKMRRIILSGADMLRFNFSYKVMRENDNHIKNAQKLVDELNASTKILIDFPLNKIRLGDFDIKTFSVRENEILTFKSGSYSPDCNQYIPVDISNLGERVYIDQMITIGDGEVSLQVIEILDKESFKARMLNNGVIHYTKTFNCGITIPEEKTLSLYKEVISQVSSLQPNFIAISYINPSVNEQIKKLIKDSKADCKIIFKIERDTPQSELEKLCQDPMCHSILIDRGEIGVNEPYERLGFIQKKVTKAVKNNHKQVIISSQILESAIHNYVPSRSDILDLTNIILDGADGIMFCMETAASLRPSYALSVAKKIMLEVEKQKAYNSGYEKK